MDGEYDVAVLAVVVTAFLIREGGQAVFSDEEWEKAILHDGSLYVTRKEEDDPMNVFLMRKVVRE